jgi:hypothetical protein
MKVGKVLRCGVVLRGVEEMRWDADVKAAG